MQILLMIFMIFYLFMIGATFASFFNVVGIRTADKVSINRRSHCPKCDNTLRWIDICPIFGWLINRGKCHFCKEPIHIKYLLIEIFGGLTFVLSFLVCGYLRIDFKFDFSYQKIIRLVMYLLIVSLMMMIVVSEYEHHVTLKKVTFVFAPILLVLSAFTGLDQFLQSMLGMGVMILLNLLLMFKNKVLLKYFLYSASLGIVLGFFGTILAILLGFLLYLIVKLCKKNIRYVYFISIGSVISLFTNPYLYELIIKIFKG